MTNIPEILVVKGERKGDRFTVPASGLRLGRSSSCEISIPDPALSRNHCLFEFRDGQLWATDLASANGTSVNDDILGADSRSLQVGDRIVAGDTVLAIVEPGGNAPAEPPEEPRIDLGFRKENPDERAKLPAMRLVLWAVAGLAVVGAATIILTSSDAAPQGQPAVKDVVAEKPALHSFSFEKVEADSKGIYRYALALSAGGELSVEIDDVPGENRHVRKSAKLSESAMRHIAEMFAAPELYQLDREYTGVPLHEGTLKSFSLHVLRGNRVFDITIENSQEPEAFRALREKLETFSKNELGIWAIQFSAEKLVEMSSESRKAGDAKWEERDVQHGNLSAALAAYREAMFYLETVNPKPADYGALVARAKEVEKELEKRYKDQRFLADRAINLQDWATARRELRVLCEMVPDSKDPRHAEAAAKLLDVENRAKKK